MLQEFIIIQYLTTQIKRSCWFCFIRSQNFSSTMLDNWIQICLKRTFGDQQLDFFQTHWSILAFSKNSHTVLVWLFQFCFSCVKSEKKTSCWDDIWMKEHVSIFPKKREETEGSKRQPSLAYEMSAWPSRQPHRVRPRYLRQHRCGGSHLSWERIA